MKLYKVDNPALCHTTQHHKLPILSNRGVSQTPRYV